MSFNRLERSDIHFVPERKPTYVGNHWVYSRALEIEPEYARTIWNEANSELDKYRNETQVIILNPRRQDITSRLNESFQDSPLGKYPVAETQEQEFTDRELEIKVVNGSERAQSVYLVASILNERDYSRVRRVADHFKNTLNAGCVTLVSTFLGGARSDKNVDKDGNWIPVTVNMRSEFAGYRGLVDRAIAFEPHSKATQAFAAQNGIALLPLSPWQFMVDNLKAKVGFDQSQTLVVRPDKGRNLAAQKIEQYLKTPAVAFEKTRLSGQETCIYELDPEEQSLVRGKTCLLYDDEAATFGTIHDLANPLQRYGAKGLDVCIVHGKFTEGWEKKIQHPLIRTALCTDSREPVGNIAFSDKVQLISLVPLLRQVIEADIAGVDFWTDERFREMIL